MNTNGTRPAVALPPTPAIVLAVGETARTIALDAQKFYFLGRNHRRQAVTRFLALVEDDEGCWRLLPVEEAVEWADSEAEAESDLYTRFVAQAMPVRLALSESIRELRTDAPLAAAGLDGVNNPALEVLLLTDLTDARCATLLFPLLYLLQELLERDPYADGHLLLTIGLFERRYTEPESPGRLAAALQRLDALLDPERCEAGQEMATALGQGPVKALDFPVYLFDQYKEGVREVRDREELCILVANVLVALLSGGLARRLRQAVPTLERQEHKAYYSSAGASILYFDPDEAINACAARLGADFLAEQFLGAPAPRGVDVKALAAAQVESWGDLDDWFARTVAGTACRYQPHERRIAVALDDLDFVGVPRRGWAEHLRSYAARYAEDRLPLYQEQMAANAGRLGEELLAQQRAFIDGLPRRLDLYPGWVANCQALLAALEKPLQARMEGLERPGPRAPQLSWQPLERALEKAARLPWLLVGLGLLSVLLGALPFGLDYLLAEGWPLSVRENMGVSVLLCGVVAVPALLALARWRKSTFALRQKLVYTLAQSYSDTLTACAHTHLAQLCADLQAQHREGVDALESLSAVLNTIQSRLSADSSHPHNDTHVSRQSALDESSLAWLYSTGRQTSAAMLEPLLLQHGFLAGWSSATVPELTEQLMCYGRDAFDPIVDITLSDVLVYKKDVACLWRQLTQSTIVLLRPTLDRAHGGKCSYITYFNMMGESIGFCGAGEKSNLESLATIRIVVDNFFLNICFQVRYVNPFIALDTLR